MSKPTRQPSGLLVPAHVQLGKPRAVHCKREHYHVYVGRNPKWLPPSKWGNPFVVDKHGTRSECIALYEAWLRENTALFAALDELRGLVLGCWCTPRACHGDVLVQLANANTAERERWLHSSPRRSAALAGLKDRTPSGDAMPARHQASAPVDAPAKERTLWS